MSDPVARHRPRTPPRRRHRAWREGGPSVARWDAEMLGWAVLSLGLGVLAARAGAVLLPGAIAEVVTQAVLWAAFAVPVVWAFRRSRPRGLTRFRAVDVLIGAVWGVGLRLAQGALDAAAGAPAWPSAGTGGVTSRLVAESVAATTVGPALEELFFRGVVLVCTYTAVRRLSGHVAAVVASLVLSSILFVVAHALVAPLGPTDAAALALVGAICGVCVLVTGRLWPAILVHVVYNGTGIAVVVVGSLYG
ncbi:CPBP family intramembrane glutamic endopeptidase [Microbacterium sp. 5K110]|uniref:CPBP family intramembrane glutamic endopeptidase n=1 Tax=unclassified Microbacterium TaxID=2609290 RepID=UPI001485822F|nr:CPBP family intramembrane glutamic endopeptidase [Microbacterium sp. 5K110]